MKKLIFIAGLHKSGTSILSRCLKEHPLISGFTNTGVPQDEGQFLQTVFLPAKHFGGPGKFGFNHQMHLTENSSLVSYENKEKLFFEWGRYWDFSKPVLLEKSPPNLLKTRFLQAMLPNCYFIVMVRHPIAVSYSTLKWSGTSIKSLLNHWICCHSIFLEDKQHLKRCFGIKYEEFVADPEKTLKGIYEFIGIHDYPNNIKIKTDTNEKYIRKWEKEKWLNKIRRMPEYQKLEKQINKFSYSLCKYNES